MIDLVKNRSRETNGDFTKLYSHDQFLKYENQSIIISEMSEAKIKFSPTYKYYIGSTSYDTTKRIPSWCDRIFYKKYSKTIPLAYNKCLLTISDHQPIYGVYKIETQKINIEKRQSILNQIIKAHEDKSKNGKKKLNENNNNSTNNANSNEDNKNNTNDKVNSESKDVITINKNNNSSDNNEVDINEKNENINFDENKKTNSN